MIFLMKAQMPSGAPSGNTPCDNTGARKRAYKESDLTGGPESDDVSPARVLDALGQRVRQEQLPHEADMDLRRVSVPRQQRHVSLGQPQQPQHLPKGVYAFPLIRYLHHGLATAGRIIHSSLNDLKPHLARVLESTVAQKGSRRGYGLVQAKGHM